MGASTASRLQPWGEALALFLVVLLVRGCLAWVPAPAGLLAVDELEVSLNAVDHWLGVPSSALVWPAAVTQVLLQPYILLSFLGRLDAAGGSPAAAFAHHIAGFYLEPARLIVAGRLISAALSSAGVACFYLAARTLGLGRTSSLAVVVFWLVAPIAFEYSLIATGDGIAWALALIAVFILVRWPRHVAIAGFVLGCAAASKVTVASLIVLHLGWIALRPADANRQRLLDAGAVVAGVALGFALVCPQVWTEPVRFAKAVVGTFLFGASQASPPLPPLNRIAAPALAGLALLIGLPALVAAPRRRRLIGALLGAALVMLLPLLVRPLTYLRYLVPVMLPFTLLAGIAYEEFVARRHVAVRAVGGVLLLALTAGLSWQTYGDQRQLRNTEDLRPLLAELKACRTPRTILLPLEFYTVRFWRLPPARETWQAALPRAASDVTGSPTVTAFLREHNLPPAVLDTFWSSFTEREQANYARLRALASVDDSTDCPLKFYLPPREILARRSPLYQLEEASAIGQLLREPDRIVLVTGAVPADWHGPALRFGRWYVLESR